MSEEPRRKRKWDNQEEVDTPAKRNLVDTSAASTNESVNAESVVPVSDTVSSVAAAQAAAAIEAARISAKLVAQGRAFTDGDHGSTSEIATDIRKDVSGTGGGGHTGNAAASKESKERDEFVKDVDINDVKHRYILTKGSVQAQLQRDTGADVTTRGKYYPDRSMATEKDPPLYLHVSAVSQEVLDLAIAKIDELIEEAQNSAPMAPQRESFQPGSRMQGGPPRHQSFHARVAIGIESDRMFNVRAKIVGPGGQNVKHVQNATRTRVQLKGHGSGYLEVETGRESDEPLFINIIGNSQEDVDKAEDLCKNLVETIRAEYERMKSRPPVQQEPFGHGRPYGGRPNYFGGGHHQRYQGSGHSQYHQQQQQQQQQQPSQYNYNQQYQGTPPPPPPPGAAPHSVNPPLPPGSPPSPPALPTEDPAASAASTPTSASAVVAAPSANAPSSLDPAAQGYTYEQYEAYNHYYYQQYYQQYGQYYQAYSAAPGTDPSQATTDPALAYYGYNYTPASNGAPAVAAGEGANALEPAVSAPPGVSATSSEPQAVPYALEDAGTSGHSMVPPPPPPEH